MSVVFDRVPCVVSVSTTLMERATPRRQATARNFIVCFCALVFSFLLLNEIRFRLFIKG